MAQTGGRGLLQRKAVNQVIQAMKVFFKESSGSQIWIKSGSAN